MGEQTGSDRRTAKVAATGTGYSGSTLDKVDKVVQIAKRGTVAAGWGKERREEPIQPRSLAGGSPK